MSKKILLRTIIPPERSDLVYHILYGKQWVGVLLGISEDRSHNKVDPFRIGLVHMLPNSKYSDYFSKTLKRYRIHDSMGYISMTWLRKLSI